MPPNVLGNKPTQQQLDNMLLEAIENGRTTDPLIGAKFAGNDILKRLMNVIKSERGVHVESLFVALGAFAGFACQMGIRAEQTRLGMTTLPLKSASLADGRVIYYGDALNKPLAESKYSIWSLAAGEAKHLGATLPDMNEIFAYVTKTAGSSDFGVPRMPGGIKPKDMPINYVRAFWPALLPILGKFCAGPSEWHIAFGLAIQNAITQAKAAIDPGAAVKIVMECAIAMSKIDPAGVGFKKS